MLSAEDVPHRVELEGSVLILLVPTEEAPRAHAALAAYDEEARGEPLAAIPDATSPRGAWVLGLAVAALLLVFFAVTGPPAAGSRWFERGAASAGHITGGEPWRTVTALTLHVDTVHVAGNALATVVLLPPVVQRVGPGLGLWLVLLAGAGANLLTTFAHDPRHVAVGASTATFGALGILVALQIYPPAVPSRRRWKGWMAPVAGLVLLALLGTGRGADVLGHAAGLIAGGALGLATGPTLRRPVGPAVQWSLVALALLAVAGSWRLALAGPGG